MRIVGLVVTYIVSIFSIIWTIAGHINYTNAVFAQHGPKFGEPMAQQHLYTTILIVGFFIVITALLTYVLRSKK